MERTMKTLRHAAYRTRETYSRSCEQPCAISRRDRCALYKQSSINYWPWADAPGTLIIETQLRHARVSLPVAIWLSLLRYSPHYRVNCQFRILLVSIKSKINVATAVWLLAMRIYLFIYLLCTGKAIGIDKFTCFKIFLQILYTNIVVLFC